MLLKNYFRDRDIMGWAKNTNIIHFEKIWGNGTEGQEFWSARELAPLLDYRDWRNFQKVLARATQACEASNQAASDHFVETTKMVVLGSGAQRELEDVHLSRYACYLVVQNGDPAKPVIAGENCYCDPEPRGGAGGQGSVQATS
ncbi:BRO family protein [Escherichia coli]|nr:BRO family protein [Escherichia coli]WCE58279.1 BRO family protein [Escherichia coli]